MSIVLWNAGLMGSLRRYGEIGVRLAIGEDKGHLYRAMIVESILIGTVGSVIGTALGVLFSYYLQVHGIDISSMMKNASMLDLGCCTGQSYSNELFYRFYSRFAGNHIGYLYFRNRYL